MLLLLLHLILVGVIQVRPPAVRVGDESVLLVVAESWTLLILLIVVARLLLHGVLQRATLLHRAGGLVRLQSCRHVHLAVHVVCSRLAQHEHLGCV